MSWVHIFHPFQDFECFNEICPIVPLGHPGTDRNFLEEFGSFLENFSMKNGKLLICGDFNYWVDNPSLKPFSMDFLELIELNNFVNHVASPTHISGHTLDLVMSPADSNYVFSIDLVPIDPAVSDHTMITFSLEHPKLPSYSKTIKFRKYNVNENMIIQEIVQSLDTIGAAALSASELVEMHNDFFSSVNDRMCPEICKVVMVRDDCRWYDSTVAALRRERRKAERKWRRIRDDRSRMLFVEARRAVVLRIHVRKVEYYKDRIDSCEGDQKKLYTAFGDLLGHKIVRALPSCTSSVQLASDFALFFDSKISRIRADLDGASLENEFSVNFRPQFQLVRVLCQFQPVVLENVLEYIRDSKKTFCQLDPINVSKISRAYEASAGFIVEIINHCFGESLFVSSEKLALLRPLLKRAGLDNNDMSNYRPVSNLSFLSKILERAILDQLVLLLEENKVVPSLQSAYKRYHSAETALCKIYNDLVLSICEGKPSLLVLLDLSAAFDTIDHQILFDDFHVVGIRNSALSLMKSYMSGRFQKVAIDDTMSDPMPLRFGVPQGSILGPLLFSVYISGLAFLLDAHDVAYHFYADDTQFYIQIENIGEAKDKVVTLLSDIRIWMTRRKLKLNDSKTEIIVIEGGNRGFNIADLGHLDVGGASLETAVSVKNLGVYFDKSLNFKQHINLLVRNCNHHIRNIYAIKKFIDRKSLPRYLLKKLQSILNRAARIVFSLPSRTPTTPFLIELHWLPVTARIKFKLCLMTYKALNYGEPKYLAELLSPLTRDFNIALRSGDDPYRLCEPRATGERSFAERSFSFTAPRLYNKLPVEIKQLASIDSFKKHLKTYFFSRAYNIDDNIMSEEYII